MSKLNNNKLKRWWRTISSFWTFNL